METIDILGLISIGAIWGSSFVFMRILAPVLGAVTTASFRVLIAGSLLFLYFQVRRTDIQFRKNFRHYFIMGLLNAALPFSCYAFAALHIPAGMSVILNGTAPLFTVALASLLLSERLTPARAMSLLLGTAGILLIALRSELVFDEWSHLAIIAGLAAAFCYAMGGVYMKKFSPGVKPVVMTGMSQLLGGIVLLPAVFYHWSGVSIPTEAVEPKIIASLLALSLMCSGAAFMIFYSLVARIGPTRAITSTYLIPVFGILWGKLFLGESITLPMIAGCVLILIGIKFSTLKNQNIFSKPIKG